MVANTTPTVTALEAEAKANLFLSGHLPDRLVAGSPRLDSDASAWHLPVLLVYPALEPVMNLRI
jgi:hypothetical protein